MSSKLEYLQRYMSDGKKKKRKKVEKKVARNLAVLDDDIDWRALAPKDDVDLEDPDEAPVVAEIRDESANAVKWQPIKSHGNEEGSGDEGLNEDLSPPRRSTEDLSPPRKRVSDDLSPPRRRKEKFFDSAERDISPPRRDHKVAEGFSVFQKVSKKSEPIRTHSAFGKAQKKGHTSPPQKRRQDPSPPRRRRHDSADASPRRKGRHDSVDHDSVDASPPRKRRHDFSSPPRRKRHDTMDASPPRRRRHDSVDASPPRKSAGGGGQQRKRDALSPSPPRPPPPHKAPRGDSSPPRHTRRAKETEFDAGLRTRRDNASARSVRDSIYKNLDPELSGAHAETVHRDKKGRVIDPQVEKVRKREEERVKAEEDEKFMEWGKGLAQVKLAQDKVADDLYEMSKPLARYRDDEDLEKMLKERERDGDPMLAFMKKKKKVKNVKGKPVKEKPTYKGAVPPNRFSVQPGYRWDGVDRSNGFEKAWFARESNKKATAEEAYKWSVEDM